MLCHHDTSLMHMICTVVKLALEDDYHLGELWSGATWRAWRSWLGDSPCVAETWAHASHTSPCQALPRGLAGRRQITHMEGSRTPGAPWQQHWTARPRAQSQTRPQRCSGTGASPRPSGSGSSPRPPRSPPESRDILKLKEAHRLNQCKLANLK